jgi:tetratricopeptide (TPR) repeat protein
VLLDRKRVKFWQKWIFLGMAILMASFLIFGYSGVLNGCSSTPAGQGTNVGDKALKALEAKAAANPNDLATLLELAQTYQRRANNGDVQLSQAQTIDWTKSSQYYERWLKAQAADTSATAPQARAAVLQQLAIVYSGLGQLDTTYFTKAFTLYDELTKLDPKNADYFLAMGQAARSAGDTQNALLAYTRYLELAPNGALASAVHDWIAQHNGSTPSPSPSGSAKP